MNETATIAAIAAALVAAQTGMIWFLLREVRAAVNGLARETSDLTLAIAIDIATRDTANVATRAVARQLVRERDAVRARELEQERDR
jgi:hypothetical protein